MPKYTEVRTHTKIKSGEIIHFKIFHTKITIENIFEEIPEDKKEIIMLQKKWNYIMEGNP